MSTAVLMPVGEYLRLTEKPYLLRAQGAQALPELTVRLSSTRYLVPDVSVTGDFPGPYPTDPVLLCCEILSTEDGLGAMLASEPARAAGDLAAGELSVGLKELFSAIDE
jgi:hypothetical protein